MISVNIKYNLLQHEKTQTTYYNWFSLSKLDYCNVFFVGLTFEDC